MLTLAALTILLKPPARALRTQSRLTTSQRSVWKRSGPLERAFERAGLPWPEGLRPCHDLRVTAITTDARNGTDPIAIMTNAGHASYSTTKRYVKLAGVIFPDTAAARAQRLLSTEPSTDLSTPESIEADLGTPSGAESSAADAA